MNPFILPLILVLIIAGTNWGIRFRSEGDREGMTDKQRVLKILK